MSIPATSLCIFEPSWSPFPQSTWLSFQASMALLIPIFFPSVFMFLASFCEAVPQNVLCEDPQGQYFWGPPGCDATIIPTYLLTKIACESPGGQVYRSASECTRTSVQTSQSLTPSSCTLTSTAYAGSVSSGCQGTSGATSATRWITASLCAPTSTSSAGSSATDCRVSSYSTLASRSRPSHSSPNNFSRGTLELSAASAQSSSGRFFTTSTAAYRKATRSDGPTYATSTSSTVSRTGSMSYLESSVRVSRISTFGPSNLTVSSFPSDSRSMATSLSETSLLSWGPLYSRTTSALSSATLASSGQRTLVPSTTVRSASSTGNASSIASIPLITTPRLSCTAEYSFISFFLPIVPDAQYLVQTLLHWFLRQVPHPTPQFAVAIMANTTRLCQGMDPSVHTLRATQ